MPCELPITTGVSKMLCGTVSISVAVVVSPTPESCELEVASIALSALLSENMSLFASVTPSLWDHDIE